MIFSNAYVLLSRITAFPPSSRNRLAVLDPKSPAPPVIIQVLPPNRFFACVEKQNLVYFYKNYVTSFIIIIIYIKFIR